MQGTTVSLFANWLGLAEEPEQTNNFGIELPEVIRSVMSEVEVRPETIVNGSRLMDIDIPEHSLFL